MIRFFENFSLRNHNTFGVEASTRYYFEFNEKEDIQYFLQNDHSLKKEKMLIIGGGSNLLFAGDFGGLTLNPDIPGIEVEKQNELNVWIRAGAGVVWDDFVGFCVESGWGGVENLSLIPGKVGAVPVQNIGAYGCEVAETIESVSCIDLSNGNLVEKRADECSFSYRNSAFKSDWSDKYLIVKVLFKLSKLPSVRLDYPGLSSKFDKQQPVTINDIRKAVIDIRRSKLPEPSALGNAGSFFKNPIVTESAARTLMAGHPQIPVYPAENGLVKIPAGWLIEQCGWKGYRRGDAGVHENHALVLVNYGNASGKELFGLSEEIRNSVLNTFGIDLEREVNVVGQFF